MFFTSAIQRGSVTPEELDDLSDGTLILGCVNKIGSLFDETQTMDIMRQYIGLSNLSREVSQYISFRLTSERIVFIFSLQLMAVKGRL